MRSRAVLLTCLLALLSGCKKPGPPSADYEEARARFTALYAEELEQAYVDPRMEEVEAQLRRVPEDSSDARLAEQLILRITSGRERVQAEEAERRREVAAAAAPSGDVAFTDDPFPEVDAGPPKAPDAGAAFPVKGMPEAELTRRFGDCFLPGRQIELGDKGPRPTYELRPTAFCKGRHPGFEKKILILEAGRILLVGDLARLEIVRPDAGVPPTPPR